MAFQMKIIIGINYFNLLKNQIYYREFIFSSKRIFLIFIISFVKIGEGELVVQNNAFICLILCVIAFYYQLKSSPYLLESLNLLDYQATSVMIATVFMGLFSSISKDGTIKLLSIFVILIMNISFLINFLRKYFILSIHCGKRSNLKSKIIHTMRIG